MLLTSFVVLCCCSFAATASPSLPVPLFAVNADIVFVIDGTSAFTQSVFNSTILYIRSFASQFLISPRHTQIALITFGDSITNGILLSSSSDQQSLQAKLRSLNYIQSAAKSWNLVGAIKYVNDIILTPAQGWRERTSTNVIFIGISESVSTPNCDTILNSPLPHCVTRFAVALNSLVSTSQYLHCAISNSQDFARADPPSSLVQGSEVDMALDMFISQSYVDHIAGDPFPVAGPLNETKLNMILVIDQTAFLSADSFSTLKTVMINFVSQFSIKPGFVSVGVVCYDQTSGDGSFPLTRGADLSSLIDSINGIRYSASSNTFFNLAGAVDFINQVMLTPVQGYDSSKASATIFFASAPFATQPQLNQVVAMNSFGGVYGMDILGVGADKNYLLKLTLGNDLNVFSVTNPSFLSPMSEGFKRLTSFSSAVSADWNSNPKRFISGSK